MKIRFSNLGTIRETVIDLRPLTVIVGPNNSSKTYLAYSIYLKKFVKLKYELVFKRVNIVSIITFLRIQVIHFLILFAH